MNRTVLKEKLDKIETFDNPDAWLEQYQTPPELAADVLWNAYISGHIETKKVCDLGCGTGIFSIGAKLLAAEEVIGIDVDKKVIDIAERNAQKYDLDIDFIVSDIEAVNSELQFDTVLQNPPFGCQKKGADLPFLKKSLEIAKIVYTMHRTETYDYLKNKIAEYNGQVIDKMTVKYPIPNTMDWHDKDVKIIDVDIIKIKRKEL